MTPSAIRQALVFASASLLLAIAAGCSDNTPAESTASASEKQAPAASPHKATHSLDALLAAGLRARPHHTVHLELQHPDGAEPGTSRRSIPYVFEHAHSQQVCLESGEDTDHQVEIHAEGGSGTPLARLHKGNRCEQVHFAAGHYEARIIHGGGQRTDHHAQVFAHPRQGGLDELSGLGKLLLAPDQSKALRKTLTTAASLSAPVDSTQSAAVPKDTGDCERVDTVTLSDKASGATLLTGYPARYGAYHELYRVSAAGLISVPNLPPPPPAPTGTSGPPLFDPSPPRVPVTSLLARADGSLAVYACGVAGGRTLKFRNQNGQYLKSQCGYPLFSATSLSEATAYLPYWNPQHQRLDLVNSNTQARLQTINRAAGRLLGTDQWTGADTLPGMGTCETMPAELDSKPAPIAWQSFSKSLFSTPFPLDASNKVATRRLAPTAVLPVAYMVAEFAYTPVTGYIYAADNSPADTPRFVLLNAGDITTKSTNTENKPTPITVVNMPAYAFGPAHRRGFTYDSGQIDDQGGFSLSRQNALVFSIGNCRQCDLSDLDLSGRRIASLDLSGSHLARANFSNSTILSLTLDHASIDATDFSGATISALSLVGATIGSVDASADTVFTGASLGDPVNFPANFSNATVIGPRVVFSRLDLRASVWTGAQLSNITFREVDLRAVKMDRARLTDVTLTGAASGSGLATGALLSGANFSGSMLTGLIAGGARAAGADFSSATLGGANLNDSDLSGATFAGATIGTSFFEKAFLVGTNFSNTTWSGSSLNSAQAYSDGSAITRFSGCTISSGSFEDALFMQSVFDGCTLKGGSFARSNFVSASLKGLQTIADESGSVLTFSQALLAGADLSNAKLDRVSLLDAVVSTQPGSTNVRIVSTPAVAGVSSGESLGRDYGFARTTLPASTGGRTICPDGSSGPCTGNAWKVQALPRWLGNEDLDTFGD